MAPRKASQSLDGPHSKSSKLFDKSSFEAAQAQIKGLEAQSKELYAFIDDRRLTKGALFAPSFADQVPTCVGTNLPASLQKHLEKREGGSRSLALSIHQATNDAYEDIEPQTWNARKTGVTLEDVSQAMVPFLANIKRLRSMPDADALRLAYGCVRDLDNHSYVDLDPGGSGYGDRYSDEPADEMLVSILKERKKKNDVWDRAKDLADLERRSKYLNDYGIETWFPKSIKFLQTWD